MEELNLSPEALEATAGIIESYCAKQKSIMDKYVSSASSLSSGWQDDQTYGALLAEIKSLRSSVCGIMDEILTSYPQYFRSRAEQIKNRPKM